MEEFASLFGQHMRANHLDVISVSDIEIAVNLEAPVPYSRPEIVRLLEVSVVYIHGTTSARLCFQRKKKQSSIRSLLF